MFRKKLPRVSILVATDPKQGLGQTVWLQQTGEQVEPADDVDGVVAVRLVPGDGRPARVQHPVPLHGQQRAAHRLRRRQRDGLQHARQGDTPNKAHAQHRRHARLPGQRGPHRRPVSLPDPRHPGKPDLDLTADPVDL